MAANDKQVGGDHYKEEFQHWDMVVHFQLDYFQAQITRYLFRWRNKGGLEDLEKAKHFLDKYMEVAHDEEVAKELGGLRKITSVNAMLVAAHGPKSGGSKEISRRKVRSPRRKG